MPSPPCSHGIGVSQQQHEFPYRRSLAGEPVQLGKRRPVVGRSIRSSESAGVRNARALQVERLYGAGVVRLGMSASLVPPRGLASPPADPIPCRADKIGAAGAYDDTDQSRQLVDNARHCEAPTEFDAPGQ